MKNKISALTADERGNIFDVPEAEGVGRVGEKFFKLKPEDFVALNRQRHEQIQSEEGQSS